MTELIDGALERQRLGTGLMSGFGIVALLLAIIGVFGVLSYIVAQRTGEMALRQALGATRGQVFGLVVSHIGWTALAGIVLGTTLAWWTGTLMSRYVFHVAPADLVVLGGSALVVALAALFATVLPAARAARLAPAEALRQA